MKISNVSLPYPVLGNSDDIIPGLPDENIKVDVSCVGEDYHFVIRLFQENEDITNLIQQGSADYTCEVTCARTYLRRCYRNSEPCIEFSISRKDVFGRMEFHCYVTVAQEIPDYRNSLQNSDYGDAAFEMEPGDILCAFNPASWNASLKYDKLYAAGSFMVVLNGGDKPNVWFDANDDNIKAYLPDSMFSQFKLLCNDRSFNEMFHASIVFNGLFKVLSEYNKNTQSNYQWAEAIKYRIDNEPELKDFNIEDTSRAYELAQALLQDPYKRLFNHLKQMQDNK